MEYFVTWLMGIFYILIGVAALFVFGFLSSAVWTIAFAVAERILGKRTSKWRARFLSFVIMWGFVILPVWFARLVDFIIIRFEL